MQWIADIFIAVLESLNALTGSYGLSLVFFAFIIKLAIWPLTTMQYKGMKKMQDLAPETERLKKEFKGDPVGLNQAMTDLYKEKGMNPLSSCLPMLVQMPILLSIWRAIMGEPELFSNAYFLWIRPGPLQLNFPNFFASSLADRDALLILVYGVTMIIQQVMTPSGGQPHQKKIGLGLSVFFTILMWFYAWPCAMIVYWVVFNFLNIIQTGLIHRSMAEQDADPATASTPETPLPAKA
jgi:YidC/Oxa1 family membrane protein insertase